jgi:hypothetical protein
MLRFKKYFSEANSTPPPTLGVASDGSGTGIDPAMFDPTLIPRFVPGNPDYDSGWKENKKPNWRTSKEGDFWFDSEGNSWQFLDGRWEVIKVAKGSGLWVGYPDAPGRLIPATRTLPRWIDTDP